jgi:hypothetical protein
MLAVNRDGSYLVLTPVVARRPSRGDRLGWLLGGGRDRQHRDRVAASADRVTDAVRGALVDPTDPRLDADDHAALRRTGFVTGYGERTATTTSFHLRAVPPGRWRRHRLAALDPRRWAGPRLAGYVEPDGTGAVVSWRVVPTVGPVTAVATVAGAVAALAVGLVAGADGAPTASTVAALAVAGVLAAATVAVWWATATAVGDAAALAEWLTDVLAAVTASSRSGTVADTTSGDTHVLWLGYRCPEEDEGMVVRPVDGADLDAGVAEVPCGACGDHHRFAVGAEPSHRAAG